MTEIKFSIKMWNYTTRHVYSAHIFIGASNSQQETLPIFLYRTTA